ATQSLFIQFRRQAAFTEVLDGMFPVQRHGRQSGVPLHAQCKFVRRDELSLNQAAHAGACVPKVKHTLENAKVSYPFFRQYVKILTHVEGGKAPALHYPVPNRSRRLTLLPLSLVVYF